MSAYNVTPKHLATIVAAWIDSGSTWNVGPVNRRLDPTNADDWQVAFDALAGANAASVAYRYSEAPCVTAGTVRGTETAGVSIVALLRAVACFEYQACEVPDWQESDVYHAMNRLRAALCSRLTGFREASWSIV